MTDSLVKDHVIRATLLELPVQNSDIYQPKAGGNNRSNEEADEEAKNCASDIVDRQWSEFLIRTSKGGIAFLRIQPSIPNGIGKDVARNIPKDEPVEDLFKI